MLENSYEKLVLSHDGFYNALYNDLKGIVTIEHTYKTLVNSSKGIDYELYKIISENLQEGVIMKSYRSMQLSKEGMMYWLAYFAQSVVSENINNGG